LPPLPPPPSSPAPEGGAGGRNVTFLKLRATPASHCARVRANRRGGKALSCCKKTQSVAVGSLIWQERGLEVVARLERRLVRQRESRGIRRRRRRGFCLRRRRPEQLDRGLRLLVPHGHLHVQVAAQLRARHDKRVPRVGALLLLKAAAGESPRLG
jgi:hypothetical protein